MLGRTFVYLSRGRGDGSSRHLAADPIQHAVDGQYAAGIFLNGTYGQPSL